MKQRSYPSLKHWRTANGLNQRDAARILGVRQQDYSRYERNATTPRPERLRIIASETGVPLEVLVGIA